MIKILFYRKIGNLLRNLIVFLNKYFLKIFNFLIKFTDFYFK